MEFIDIMLLCIYAPFALAVLTKIPCTAARDGVAILLQHPSQFAIFAEVHNRVRFEGVLYQWKQRDSMHGSRCASWS